MAQKRLILTVGLPRSGKSTWAKEQGHPIVNRDAIRLALHGQPYIQLAESIITGIEDCMVRALFLAGHDTVIVDATHGSRKRRDRWKNENWEIGFKDFVVSMDECIKRARLSGREDLIPIIVRMTENFENVEYDEVE